MTERQDVVPHVVGTIRAVDGVGVVRMEDSYDTTAADLWTALTDPDRLRRWMGEVSGDLRVGGTFEARFASTWEGPGRVEECDAPHRLRVTLAPGTDEETEIEAELVADGNRTWIWIEERGLPISDLPGHGAGWQAHVEDLGSHLAGREPRPWRSRWEELIPSYREQAAANDG